MNNGPEWMDDEQQTGLAGHGEPARAAEETAPAAGEPTGAAESGPVQAGEGTGPPAEEVAVMETDLALAALERELGRALRPLELPVGFADRVLAAAEAEGAKAKRPAKVVPFRGAFRSWRMVAGGAIAASVLAGSFMADEIHQRRERERAAVTQQQFETAVQVSNHALDEARAQLQRAAFRINQ